MSKSCMHEALVGIEVDVHVGKQWRCADCAMPFGPSTVPPSLELRMPKPMDDDERLRVMRQKLEEHSRRNWMLERETMARVLAPLADEWNYGAEGPRECVARVMAELKRWRMGEPVRP